MVEPVGQKYPAYITQIVGRTSSDQVWKYQKRKAQQNKTNNKSDAYTKHITHKQKLHCQTKISFNQHNTQQINVVL
jgi:hypothetical protein